MEPGFTPEEAIIGSLVSDASYSLPRLKGILKTEHFADFNLSEIFGLIMGIDLEGRPIDIVTVLATVPPSQKDLLVSICEKFPGATNVEHYRDLVIKAYHERRLKEHFKTGLGSADGEVIGKIGEEWKGIQSLGARKFDLNQMILAYSDVLEKRGKGDETKYITGFPSLDYKFPLMKRGEMCMIGARTSLGKTSLLLSLMLKMAQSGLRVVFCSGEMSFNQLMDRVISLQTLIPLMKIRTGKVEKEDWKKINKTFSEISGDMKIRFVEAAKLSLNKIMPHIIDFKPDVLFIDYIQRFSADGKIDTRAAFYSDIANSLKGLAVERNIVVIVASQLGRDVEKRKDEPRLSDLKESGGLEEAADVVWCLHTEKTEDLPTSAIEYKMLILKNRNGPTFTFQAIFNPTIAMFKEAYHEHGNANKN